MMPGTINRLKRPFCSAGQRANLPSPQISGSWTNETVWAAWAGRQYHATLAIADGRKFYRLVK